MQFVLKDMLLFSPLLLAFGGSIAVYYYHSLDFSFRVIGIFLWCHLAIDVLGHLSAALFDYNLWLLPVLALCELLLWSLVFHLVLFRKRKQVLLVLSVAGCLFLAWQSVEAILGTWQMVPNVRILATSIITMMSAALLLDRVQEQPTRDYFSINAAILVYYSLSSVLFIPVDFLIYEPTVIKFYFWMANFLFTLAFYATLIVQLWKHGKNRQPLHFG